MSGNPEIFTVETWRDKIRSRLRGWSKPAAHTLYGFLGAMSLWPLVEAMQQGQMMPVLLTLGNVAEGVGANLLANQVQRWADGGDVQPKEMISWLERATKTNDDLLKALDEILLALDVMQVAEMNLKEEDRAWFVQTLREELQKLGMVQIDRFVP